MIFESNKVVVEILSFTKLEQENVVRHTKGRTFDALSFRFHADTVLSTPQSSHRVTSNDVCFVPAGIEYNRISQKDFLIAINCRIQGYQAKDIECFSPQNPEKLAMFFKKAFACWTKKDTGYYHRCVGYFYQILAECNVQMSTNQPHESKIQASADYMNANFADPELSLGEIAAKSFMSEVYFRKIFKQEFGISPQKHIIKLRLQKAAELMETGDFALKEIALMSGYTDYKYFSSEFKRFYGVSPSEY